MITYHLSNTQRKELLDRGSPLLLALPVPLDRPADLVAWARSVLELDVAPLVAEAQRRSIWVAIFSGRDRETLTGQFGRILHDNPQGTFTLRVEVIAATIKPDKPRNPTRPLSWPAWVQFGEDQYP